MPGIDSLKVLFTYAIAAIMLLGGLAYLALIPPDAANGADRLAIVGFMGSSITFVFMRETATNSARQTERATAAAVASQPTVTTSGNPPTTTVTPPVAEPVP